MNSQQPPVPAAILITQYLPLAEKILLMSLAIGATMMAMEIDTSVASVSLIGLAVIFFLSAYRPLALPPVDNVSIRPADAVPQDEALGFSALLALTIAPKVLWLSSAISVFGIAAYILDFKSDGYQNMLMIGGATIVIGILILIVSKVTGVKRINAVMPILLRAVPVCLVDFYILFK
jgi:hypothetical protein